MQHIDFLYQFIPNSHWKGGIESLILLAHKTSSTHGSVITVGAWSQANSSFISMYYWAVKIKKESLKHNLNGKGSVLCMLKGHICIKYIFYLKIESIIPIASIQTGTNCNTVKHYHIHRQIKCYFKMLTLL